MGVEVSQHIEGQYEFWLVGPEQLWVELLAGKLLCDKNVVVRLAFEQGILELLSRFGSGSRPREKLP